MKLMLSNKTNKPKPSIKTKIISHSKHVNLSHPVNQVLSEIVSKKPFSSCGCGK